MMRFHGPSISAIADRSSASYRGRAKKTELLHLQGMKDDKWRQRIEAAVEKDGRSLRDISLAAGLSHGYLHGILRDGKEPTLDRFVKICRALNISLAYALMGVDVSDDTLKLIEVIEQGGPRRDAILALLANS